MTEKTKLVIVILAGLIVTGLGLAVILLRRTIEIRNEPKVEFLKETQYLVQTTTFIKVEKRVFIGYRTVTAYDPSDPKQTRPNCKKQNTCCIGAYGRNLCSMLKNGEAVAASNKLPQGTRIEAGGAEYEIQDRTAEKYSERIDIAMLEGAKEWGVKVLPVYQIIEK